MPLAGSKKGEGAFSTAVHVACHPELKRVLRDLAHRRSMASGSGETIPVAAVMRDAAIQLLEREGYDVSQLKELARVMSQAKTTMRLAVNAEEFASVSPEHGDRPSSYFTGSGLLAVWKLRLDGHNTVDTGAILGINKSTVSRVFGRIDELSAGLEPDEVIDMIDEIDAQLAAAIDPTVPTDVVPAPPRSTGAEAPAVRPRVRVRAGDLTGESVTIVEAG